MYVENGGTLRNYGNSFCDHDTDLYSSYVLCVNQYCLSTIRKCSGLGSVRSHKLRRLSCLFACISRDCWMILVEM